MTKDSRQAGAYKFIELESGVLITPYEQMRAADYKPKLGPHDCRPETIDKLKNRIHQIFHGGLDSAG